MPRISSTTWRGQRLGLRRNTPLIDLVPPSGALTLGSVGPTVTAVGSPNFFVAPNGLPTNGGQLGSPWDLQTALSGAGNAITPGSTVWLRGGTYPGTFTTGTGLTGTSAQPIVIRQYPGERATIDGNLVAFNGAFVWFWGFELLTSANPPPVVEAITTRIPGVKFINLILHDAPADGIGSFVAVDTEIYGCLVYNNGWVVNNGTLSHGIYIQNPDLSASKLVAENVIFYNGFYDLHAYGTNAGLQNLTFTGNVGLGTAEKNLGWLLKSDNAQPHVNLLWQENMMYGNRNTTAFTFGPNSPSGHDLAFINNYIWCGTGEFHNWDNLTVRGNRLAILNYRFYSPLASGYPAQPPYSFDANTYWSFPTAPHILPFFNNVQQPELTFAQWKAATGYDATSTVTESASGKPTVNQTFVRPNKYEAGRANIVVYNWQNLASVAVDVSGVLPIGSTYKVVNVLDFYGTPAVSGTYAGGAISIPMTAVTPHAPVVGWPNGAPPVPGPEFGVFVLLPT